MNYSKDDQIILERRFVPDEIDLSTVNEEDDEGYASESNTDDDISMKSLNRTLSNEYDGIISNSRSCKLLKRKPK